MPVISKGENNVGSIQIDPLVTCKQHCYLGLSVDTNSKHNTLIIFAIYKLKTHRCILIFIIILQ